MTIQSQIFDMLPDDTIDSASSEAETTVLSVSAVSQSLKKCVEGNFRNIKIRGEITGFKRHTSGHSYFALKDDEAVIDAVAWRGTAITVPLEDGIEVIITGRITTYPGRSKYQVIVEHIAAAGKGTLMQMLMERKERLAREGLFQRKRPLPVFPQRIGVITSPTGAVIKDILHRLNERFPCNVIVWPTLVQGPGAAELITAAINGMNILPEQQRPDVIIVARGGGSLEDLWAFNEECVVRATAYSNIPIISAIGHETDTTLIDFASDQRAPTPTAAAELATPVRAQLIARITELQQRMHDHALRNLRMRWITVKGYVRGLPQPQALIEAAMQRLDDRAERLEHAIQRNITTKTHALTMLNLAHPRTCIQLNQQRLAHINERFTRSTNNYMQQKLQNFDYLTKRLEQGSYAKILDKGFSFVTSESHVIARAHQFPSETKAITLHFSDGTVTITPQDIVKNMATSNRLAS